VSLGTCFYCKKSLGFNEPYYLIRTKDRHFRGRKRHQTVAYCCIDCEDAGKQCHFSSEEWRALKAEIAEQEISA